MFHIVYTKDEALNILNEKDVYPVAGATDLLLQINAGKKDKKSLLDISRIPELKGIYDSGKYIEIQAATTLQEILDSNVIKNFFPHFYTAVKSIGSPQIKHIATLGGNLCNASPASDSAVPLLTLDAEVLLESVEGKRMVALNDFFVAPGKTVLKKGELLTKVLIKKPEGKSFKFSFFKKFGKRRANIIATVNFAAFIEVLDNKISNFKVACGSVAPKPLLLKEFSSFFVGKDVKSELYEKNREKINELIDSLISPISDVRGSKEYKTVLVKNSFELMFLNFFEVYNEKK